MISQQASSLGVICMNLVRFHETKALLAKTGAGPKYLNQLDVEGLMDHFTVSEEISNPVTQEDIRANEMALVVKRRRIYDVVNVLHCPNIASRQDAHSCCYNWNALAIVNETVDALRAEVRSQTEVTSSERSMPSVDVLVQRATAVGDSLQGGVRSEQSRSSSGCHTVNNSASCSGIRSKEDHTPEPEKCDVVGGKDFAHQQVNEKGNGSNNSMPEDETEQKMTLKDLTEGLIKLFLEKEARFCSLRTCQSQKRLLMFDARCDHPLHQLPHLCFICRRTAHIKLY